MNKLVYLSVLSIFPSGYLPIGALDGATKVVPSFTNKHKENMLNSGTISTVWLGFTEL